ncbi:hypothetical protein Q8F55_008298 [Vanrija albida]|uniref:Uncharacterized protein n=1 Tax=Vanrija albida TaxID=181172 RepID=A0ABR3PW67_9TREE
MSCPSHRSRSNPGAMRVPSVPVSPAAWAESHAKAFSVGHVRAAPDAMALLESVRARLEPEYTRAVLHAYAGSKLARGRPPARVNAKLLALERQYPLYAPDFAAVRTALDLPLCMILGPTTPGYDAENPFHYAHRGRVPPPPAYDDGLPGYAEPSGLATLPGYAA